MRDSKVADKQPEQKKLRKPAYEKKNPRANAEWRGRKHERNAAKRNSCGLCKHTLVGNPHGAEREASGECTYCRECNPRLFKFRAAGQK